MGILEDLQDRLERVETELAILREEQLAHPEPSLEEPISLQEFCRKHPEFTVPKLRWHIQTKPALERQRAVTRMGRRMYINEREFLAAWKKGLRRDV